MAALIPLVASKINNFFSSPFKRRGGVAAFVHIDDVNSIINTINELAENQAQQIVQTFILNYEPGVVPPFTGTALRAGGGVVVCQGLCSCSSTGTLKYDFCCGASYYYDKTLVKTGGSFTGSDFRLTILPYKDIPAEDGTPAQNVNWAETSIVVGNLAVPGFVSVEKISINEYSIKTYNAAGIFEPALLNHVPVIITTILPPNQWTIQD